MLILMSRCLQSYMYRTAREGHIALIRSRCDLVRAYSAVGVLFTAGQFEDEQLRYEQWSRIGSECAYPWHRTCRRVSGHM